MIFMMITRTIPKRIKKKMVGDRDRRVAEEPRCDRCGKRPVTDGVFCAKCAAHIEAGGLLDYSS